MFDSEETPEPINLNSRGETFGSALSASTPAGEPDLVKASGRDREGNVVDGYVRKSDLAQPQPESPEQAVEMMRGKVEKRVELPLYLSDGTTVVGAFSAMRLVEPESPGSGS